jgi:molecular chaperone DnaJ
MQVRLSNQGDVGRNGGPPGNLYVQLDVKEHPFFTREDFDLLYRLPVNMAEAALGVEKEVPTLDGGPVAVKVPQGTQPGTEFRIRGKGIPHINSSRRGDLRVQVHLEVPRNLNAHQRKLLEELAGSMGHNGKVNDGPETEPKPAAKPESKPAPETEPDEDKGLFDRIKDAFG